MEVTSGTVELGTYLSALTALTDRGESVSLAVTGSSMSPFLVPGRDQLCFRRVEGPLKRGDMALFRRRNGAYVMHRIARVDPAAGYYLVGDGQQELEGPVAPEQICGIVTRVCRKGIWQGPESFWWRFFAGPWLWLRPMRPQLRQAYGTLSRLWKGGSPHGTKDI